MSRVFRNAERDEDRHLFGYYSYLLFDTDDPNETATRVYDTGRVSCSGPIWTLGEIENYIMLRDCVGKWSEGWVEVTDDPEVQAALIALDKEQSAV